jgi:hypothetical protein
MFPQLFHVIARRQGHCDVTAVGGVMLRTGCVNSGFTPQFLLISAICNPQKEFHIVTMNAVRYDMARALSQQF